MSRYPPRPPAKLESMRGPGFTNWALKGHVLCGPHPGNTASEVVKSLAGILDAGVTTFVCLQQVCAFCTWKAYVRVFVSVRVCLYFRRVARLACLLYVLTARGRVCVCS